MKKGKYKFQNEIQDVDVYENKEEFINALRESIKNYLDKNAYLNNDLVNAQIKRFIKLMNDMLIERTYTSVDKDNIYYKIIKILNNYINKASLSIKDLIITNCNNEESFRNTLKHTISISNLIVTNTTIL